MTSTFGTTTASAQPPMFVNVYRNQHKTPLWEQAFVSLWLFITFLPLPGATPLRYLCILVFILLMVVSRKTFVPLMFKSWPILLLPVLGLFSFFWSPYPAAAMRQGVLLLLTPLIIMTLIARVRAADILRCTMIAGMGALLLSVPYIGNLNEGGPYGSKNIFAFQMLFVTLLSFASALNSEEPLLLRLIALMLFPIAFVFQYLAESATSLVFAVLGIVAIAAIRFIPRSLTTSLIFSGVIFVLLAAAFALSNPQLTLVDDFFNLVGKDATLTGRTAIWNGAASASSEHPWFGVGLEGFWQYDTGLAQTLNENDHKEFGTKLSFHSAFWETRVHLGWVGMSIFIFSIIWCGIRTLSLWFSTGNLTASTLLILFLVVLVSCFTESYAWGTFNTMVNMLYLGGLAAFRNGEKQYVGRARVKVA